ncbi:MAG: MotA/TolQ/ExbB proton channel family protein [Myxococcales bacterium]|nr:MotA/TolQ/ExbB proton channel family protein [Myxococcales bacterium]
MNPWHLAVESEGVVLGVLILLIFFSVTSWFVIVFKWLALRRAKSQSVKFIETFWQSKRLDTIYQVSERLKASPVSKVFRAGYIELSKLKGGTGPGPQPNGGGGGGEGNPTMSGALGGIENVERSLRRATTSETTSLEGMLAYLASVGSTAPFVGLFGTVWGIMKAFSNLSTATDLSIMTVSGPIAEALIATAIGLFAAIPAVLAYNYYSNRVRVLSAEMENFSNDFLNIVKRHFFK